MCDHGNDHTSCSTPTKLNCVSSATFGESNHREPQKNGKRRRGLEGSCVDPERVIYGRPVAGHILTFHSKRVHMRSDSIHPSSGEAEGASANLSACIVTSDACE